MILFKVTFGNKSLIILLIGIFHIFLSFASFDISYANEPLVTNFSKDDIKKLEDFKVKSSGSVEIKDIQLPEKNETPTDTNNPNEGNPDKDTSTGESKPEDPMYPKPIPSTGGDSESGTETGSNQTRSDQPPLTYGLDNARNGQFSPNPSFVSVSNGGSFWYSLKRSLSDLYRDTVYATYTLGSSVGNWVNRAWDRTWDSITNLPNVAQAKFADYFSAARDTVGGQITSIVLNITSFFRKAFSATDIGFIELNRKKDKATNDGDGIKDSRVIFSGVVTLDRNSAGSLFGVWSNTPGGVDPYNRNISIEQVKAGNGDIIITVHGWNRESIGQTPESFRNLNYMKPFASSIAYSKFGTDQNIMAINWMEASSFETTGNTTFDDEFNLSVENAALWITPTAKSIAKYLSDSNTDISTVILDGHSLGAYLSYKIVEEYQKLHPDKKAKAILILDIAAELNGSEYDLDGNTKGIQGVKNLNFKSKFDNVLRLTGINSLAGDTKINFDTDVSLGVDYGTSVSNTPGTKKAKNTDLGKEHSQIPETIKNAYINGVEIPIESVTNALDPKNAKALNKALQDKTNASPRFMFENIDLVYDAILVAKERYYVSGVYSENEIKDQKSKLASEKKGTSLDQGSIVPNITETKDKKSSTLPSDKDEPMAIAIKTSVPDDLKSNSKCNSSNTYTVYDSNKGNKVVPYSVINDEVKSSCSVLKSDGNKDEIIAVENVPTVMYGEGDDDVFNLSKVGDDAKDIYVKDYGVGNDKIKLNKKYEGMYRLSNRSDGSVDLVLDDKYTGSENLVIANIRGPNALSLSDPNEFKNKVSFVNIN